MEYLVVILEIVGTAAFALSGGVIGLKKKMDIFGVCMLGLTTAVGGGIIRDIMLGLTPPAVFSSPGYIAMAVAVPALLFVPAIRRPLAAEGAVHDRLLLWADSAGLGVFTVCGVKAAVDAGYGGQWLLLVFVAVMTGVGGGVLRDVFAGDRPYIFVKHIYACASIAGALLCRALWYAAGMNISMLAGMLLVFALRLLSAKFRWSLPNARNI